MKGTSTDGEIKRCHAITMPAVPLMINAIYTPFSPSLFLHWTSSFQNLAKPPIRSQSFVLDDLTGFSKVSSKITSNVGVSRKWRTKTKTNDESRKTTHVFSPPRCWCGLPFPTQWNVSSWVFHAKTLQFFSLHCLGLGSLLSYCHHHPCSPPALGFEGFMTCS